MTGRDDDLSEAVVLHLRHHPRSNEAELEASVTARRLRGAVQALLDEAMRVPLEWDGKSLAEIGAEVRDAMRARHPGLSEPALQKLGSYVTYQVR